MSAHDNQPYAHHAHLPFAHQPLKALYVFQRLFTTLVLVPYWVTYYSILPRKYRPRESWSIRQILNVNFTRRIYKITEVAGVTWDTRDPQKEPLAGSLKETRFEWAKPLPATHRTGIIVGDVPFTRVGCYIWPKDPPVQKAYKDVEERSIAISEIYSVEYRLLQHAPFPAAVQDAATIYAHVVERYRSPEFGRHKIILIGDSSGGNLVLALTRWVRDEGKLPMPDGLLLLSPSCDVSHALQESLITYVPRPNAETDYLTDTPEPRELLQRTFLGFNLSRENQAEEQRLMEIAHSEYVSPCSPRVLQEWSHPTYPTGFDATPRELVLSKQNTRNMDSPYRPLLKFEKLFENFPRTLLVVGNAERLVREVMCLQEAMQRDGVDIQAEWMQDAVHDALIIADGWWDTEVIKKTWKVIEGWIADFQVD
ncbi:hypothetical protein H0H87_002338 [Tephrocybe sp. NHM501043]|nr:hypothetical protein H0H87_002338 [Tephrocybe sp. NHM501043]